MLFLSFALSTRWLLFAERSSLGPKDVPELALFWRLPFRLNAQSTVFHQNLQTKKPSPRHAVGLSAERCMLRTDRTTSIARCVLCHCPACLERWPKDCRNIEFQFQVTFLDAGTGTG